MSNPAITPAAPAPDGSGRRGRRAWIVSRLVRIQQQIAALEAEQITLQAEAVDLAVASVEDRADEPDAARAEEVAVRSVAADIAAATRMNDRTVQRRMSDAWCMGSQFPTTLTALGSGTISSAHARAIADAGLRITDDDARAAYEVAALAVAERETVARLRPIVRVLADRVFPISLTERHRAAREKRRIVVTDVEDGMSELFALLPSELAHAIYDRLARYAHTTITQPATGNRPDSPDHDADLRSRDEHRADVFTDLLLTGHATLTASNESLEAGDAIRAHVQITIPATTLTDNPATDGPTTDDPTTDASIAEVPPDRAGAAPSDGPPGSDRATAAAGPPGPAERSPDATTEGSPGTYRAAPSTHDAADTGHIMSSDVPRLANGAVCSPDAARRLAGHASGWDRLFHHSHTGMILGVDRYRPSEEQRRLLRARDHHCRFPGCRTRVAHCDLDHTIDAQYGGRTHTDNLAHLCRRHHTLKHHTAWTVTHHSGGILEWTSPTGRTYTDTPHARVAFTPEPPPRAHSHLDSGADADPETGPDPEPCPF